MSSKKAKAQSKSESSIKGKLVEMIIAAMHEAPGIEIKKNIKLPAVRNPKRKREIDVLVRGRFAGYLIQIAIECKNYKSLIDVPKIDAYIGKLLDIGIPSQQGIYVSAMGYTNGALERAKEVGIIPLVLTGLTPDRLAAEISKTIQSVVHLLVEITNLEIYRPIEPVESFRFSLFLHNQQGEIKASIPDLIWKKWIEGYPPPKLGEYNIEIELPNGLGYHINNTYEPAISAKATVRVIGLLVEFEGQTAQHALLNPLKEEVDRFQANASFSVPDGKYPVIRFQEEIELQNHIDSILGKVKLVTRYKLPRIRFNHLYWPLSKNAAIKFALLSEQCFLEGRQATDEEIQQIEGDDLSTIWEPIWEENPILRELA